MTDIHAAAEEIRQFAEGRQAKVEAEKAFDAKVERVSMHLLGRQTDPAPGIDWFACRTWTVNEVRALVRSALEAEKATE